MTPSAVSQPPGSAVGRIVPSEVISEVISQILGPGGLVAAALPGYEARPGQLAMAERIAEAIDRDDRLFVEAGTGTGKTLAYLVPALLSGRKVVISTGTKTLQDQIARVDLPRLRAILPQPFEWSVMKGLNNYLCLRRLNEATRQASMVANPELDRILAWAASTTSGDRAELADESSLWREVSATPETRLGSRCPHFESCFVTGMRRRALDAQLVIVNHHLFFADLALRATWPEAQVLPPYEVVIFDEAHQIEEIATEFFGMHVSTQRVFALARDLGRASGLDPTRAEPTAARLLATARALGEACGCGATTSSTACSTRSRPGSTSTPTRSARRATPPSWPGSDGARRPCATSWARWSTAGAPAPCAGSRPRRAT
jgi:ATP-dependent DNA helicase DinG